MLKIGITGGIGSGKSVVSKLFGLLGVPVFDSDKEARHLIDTDPDIRIQLEAAFGRSVYLPGTDGLDRKKLGALVFNDTTALERLNQITHPPVIKAAREWMRDKETEFGGVWKNWILQHKGLDMDCLKNGTAPAGYVVKEAALLFESGSYASLDFVISVYADKEIRIQRVSERDHIGYESVQARIEKQMPEAEKIALSNGVIENNPGILVWPQVLNWHAYFQEMSRELLFASDPQRFKDVE